MKTSVPLFALLCALLFSGAALTPPARADDAATHIALAQTAANGGDLDKALAELDQAVALEPDNVAALTARSIVCATRKDFAGAVGSLTHLLELQPNNFNALRLRAGMYGQLGENAKGEADFIGFLRLSDEGFQGVKAQAQAATDKGDWAQAFKVWNLLAQAHPSDAVSLFNRGKARLRLHPPQMMFDPYDHHGDEVLSQADFDAALKADPNLVSVAVFRTEHSQQLSASTEDSQKDIADLSALLRRFPDNIEVSLGRAAVAARLSVYTTDAGYAAFHQMRIDDLSRVLQLDPKNFAALLGRAQTLTNDSGKREMALSDVSAALLLQPDNLDALRTRVGLLGGKDAALAVADYDRIFALDPRAGEDDLLLVNRVEALGGLPDTTRAFAEINRLIAQKPDSILFLHERAGLYRGQKDYARSLADLDKALALQDDKTGYIYQSYSRERAEIVAAQKAAG